MNEGEMGNDAFASRSCPYSGRNSEETSLNDSKMAVQGQSGEEV